MGVGNLLNPKRVCASFWSRLQPRASTPSTQEAFASSLLFTTIEFGRIEGANSPPNGFQVDRNLR